MFPKQLYAISVAIGVLMVPTALATEYESEILIIRGDSKLLKTIRVASENPAINHEKFVETVDGLIQSNKIEELYRELKAIKLFETFTFTKKTGEITFDDGEIMDLGYRIENEISSRDEQPDLLHVRLWVESQESITPKATRTRNLTSGTEALVNRWNVFSYWSEENITTMVLNRVTADFPAPKKPATPLRAAVRFEFLEVSVADLDKFKLAGSDTRVKALDWLRERSTVFEGSRVELTGLKSGNQSYLYGSLGHSPWSGYVSFDFELVQLIAENGEAAVKIIGGFTPPGKFRETAVYEFNTITGLRDKHTNVIEPTEKTRVADRLVVMLTTAEIRDREAFQKFKTSRDLISDSPAREGITTQHYRVPMGFIEKMHLKYPRKFDPDGQALPSELLCEYMKKEGLPLTDENEVVFIVRESILRLTAPSETHEALSDYFKKMK